jgi:beta-mannosidase
MTCDKLRSSSTRAIMHAIRPLTQNWRFTQIGGGLGTENGEWLHAFQFPTTIHTELLKLKKIPDPVSLDRLRVQFCLEFYTIC